MVKLCVLLQPYNLFAEISVFCLRSCVNMNLMYAMEAMGESFALAQKWDIQPAKVADVRIGCNINL